MWAIPKLGKQEMSKKQTCVDLALRECELHLLYCAVGEQADYADTQQGDNTDTQIHRYRYAYMYM